MDIKLVMFRENGSRRDFPLPEGTTKIGRKEDCGIRIPLSEVSRHHAEIIVDEEGVVVRDSGAANGTFLNNRRVKEEDLEPGDQIRIGPVVFTVQIDGEPGDDELVEIRTKIHAHKGAQKGAGAVGTSKHVYVSDEEVDPIAALEALASDTDQTVVNPEEDE